MNKLFELLEAERAIIPDINADYDIGFNNGLVVAQAIALKHDFEPVVRCKDCKHRVELTKMCAHPRAMGWDALETEDDDFCSYGERKDNE